MLTAIVQHSHRKHWMMSKFLELASKVIVAFEIFISIDDSLGKKGKATKHLEAVDYQQIILRAAGRSRPTPTASATFIVQ